MGAAARIVRASGQPHRVLSLAGVPLGDFAIAEVAFAHCYPFVRVLLYGGALTSVTVCLARRIGFLESSVARQKFKVLASVHIWSFYGMFAP